MQYTNNNLNRKSTASSIGIVSCLQLIQKLLALVKQMLIAPFFGASGLTDAWFVAYSIPEMLINFLGFNTMKSAVTSFFTHMQHEKPDEIDEHFSSLFNLIMVCGIIISTSFVFLAPFITRLIAKDLPTNELFVATKLSRIVLPIVVLMGLSNFVMSILTSYRKYSIPAISQILMNILAISFLVIFHKIMGINSLAWGFLLGCAGAFIIQIPFLRKTGVKYRLNFSFFSGASKEFLTFFSPLFLPLIFSQINLIVQKNLASSLRPLGKITAISFSQLIVGSLIFLLVQPFITVLLPKLSSYAAQRNQDKVTSTLKVVFSLFYLIFIPLTILIFIFSKDITILLFQRGNFDQYATSITTESIKALSLSILFWAFSLMFSQSLIAMKDTKTVSIIESVTAILNIVLCIILTKQYDLFGLVLSISITYMIRAIIYSILFFYRKIIKCEILSFIQFLMHFTLSLPLVILFKHTFSFLLSNGNPIICTLGLLSVSLIVFIVNGLLWLLIGQENRKMLRKFLSHDKEI